MTSFPSNLSLLVVLLLTVVEGPSFVLLPSEDDNIKAIEIKMIIGVFASCKLLGGGVMVVSKVVSRQE